MQRATSLHLQMVAVSDEPHPFGLQDGDRVLSWGGANALISYLDLLQAKDKLARAVGPMIPDRLQPMIRAASVWPSQALAVQQRRYASPVQSELSFCGNCEWLLPHSGSVLCDEL